QVSEEVLDPIEETPRRTTDVAPEILGAPRHAIGDPVEEPLRVDVLGSDHTEGNLPGGTESVVNKFIVGGDSRHVNRRDRVPEALVDGRDEGVRDHRIAGARGVDAVQAEDASEVARRQIRGSVAVDVDALLPELVEEPERVDRGDLDTAPLLGVGDG